MISQPKMPPESCPVLPLGLQWCLHLSLHYSTKINNIVGQDLWEEKKNKYLFFILFP